MDYKVLLESVEGLFLIELINFLILSNVLVFLNDVIFDLNWVGFYMYKNGILIFGFF